MPGTQIGGAKAAAKNKSKFGPDFYAKIGAMGGAASGTGGFAANKKLASTMGRRGGQASRKGHKLIRKDDKYRYYIKTSTGELVKHEY